MEKLVLTTTKSQKLSKLVAGSVTYSAFMKALRNKDVKINGVRVNKDVSLAVGDSVEIFYAAVKKDGFSEIYSDQNVVVIDKRAGVTSEEIFGQVMVKYESARFIHRLDRNTCGVMIFALNDSAEKELLLGFKERTFTKLYHATVKGIVKPESAVLTAYLLKDEDAATVKIFSNPTRGAVQIKTGYRTLKNYVDTTLLEVELFTGKTHQIRAHLAYMGYPIVGDGKYGDNQFNRAKNAKKQMLRAKKLILRFDSKSSLYYLNGKTFTSEI